MTPPNISVVIPALNEEAYLGETLAAVSLAISELGEVAEVIVANSGSEDRTVEIAKEHGARVVEAGKGNVAIARNAGAREAQGEILVFVDADTLWPAQLLVRISQEMRAAHCLGGAVDTEYRPQKRLVQVYLAGWRVLGRLTKMAQGATQFCRSDVFAQVGGYNEETYMGEDVEFVWCLQKEVRRRKGSFRLIDDLQVVPSCRRFDQWPLWKTLLFTNPMIVALFPRRRGVWAGWYQHLTR